MPDFNDRGPEFRGEMPPPPPMGGPGMMDGGLYHPGAHFGPSVGTEKNSDAIDEKVKLEDIREIPKYDIIKRFKAWRTYRKQYASFNRIKESMYWRMVKLNRIDEKLQKYGNYPDDVINRDKLMRERVKLQNYLLTWQNALNRTTKVKLQTYAKALGYEILPDDAFEILNPPKKENKNDAEKKEEVKSQEVKSTDSIKKEKTKEETPPVRPVVENNVNINTDTNLSIKKNKNKRHRSSTKKNNKNNNSTAHTTNINVTNTEKLIRLYELLVKKYGKEDAKKYLENFIEQERRKSSLDELSDMLNGVNDKIEKRSVRK